MNALNYLPDTAKLPPIAVSINKSVELTGVGRSTIYAAIKRGDLETLKVGSRRLVRLEALDAWLNSYRVG